MPKIDWTNFPLIEGLVTLLVSAATLLGIFFGWWKSLWQYAKRIVLRYRPTVPRETVRIVPSPRGNDWTEASHRDSPVMFAVAHFYATNIIDDEVRILRVFLKNPAIDGSVSVQHPESNMFGSYPIPPKTTSEISLDFLIAPPVRDVGEDLKATLVIVDQFGNEHRLKHVVFDAPRPTPSPTPLEPEEFIYAIEDPIEKEVVSVLKSERARYGNCGRRVGGLGSVFISYKGCDFIGVGTDSWKPDSPHYQSVIPDPQDASLTSDNLNALVGFYSGLNSEKERERFVSALLHRLGKNTSYLDVSYFIVAVLWKVDRLGAALHKAKSDLPVGERKQFGLSNVLMLLNGLLKYRHCDFSSEELDEIERMIHGLAEHPFKIPEKIAAIRASRLAKSVPQG